VGYNSLRKFSMQIVEPQTVGVLDTLRKNSFLGKHRHFSASNRCNLLHVWLGVIAIIISLFLGSAFVVIITNEMPIKAKWACSLLAVVTAVIGVIQTFLGFQGKSMSHMSVANRYLDLQRECERILGGYCDGMISVDAVSQTVVELKTRYNAILASADSLRTSERDFTKALRMLQAAEAYESENKIFMKELDSHEKNINHETT
jgi:hypothetical protein